MAEGTLNKVMLIGRLGDDIKIHYFDGGSCIGRFSIATNESYTNKETGQKIITTEWHNIVVKNKLAEICEKHLSKGDKVYCEGKIKTREWELEGTKKKRTEIHVQEMNFLSSKPDNKNSIPSNTEVPNSKGIIDNLPF